MFSSPFEIIALIAQPEDPDEDAFVHKFNDLRTTRVSAKAHQRQRILEFEAGASL